MPNSIVTVSTRAPGGIRSVVENYQRSRVFEGYETHWVASHDEGSALHRIALFLRCLGQLLGLRARGHRLYHLHMAMKGSFFRKTLILDLLRLSGARVVLHLHGSEFADFHQGASPLVKRLVRHTFRAADVVVVLSRRWQDFVRSIDSGIRSRIIYNYVEPVPELPGPPRDRTRFVFMGAVGRRKGVYDLIPAFARLREQYPEVELVICGTGELEAARDAVARHGLDDAVTFAGWVSGADKDAMLNSADVLVLPSYNEGLPMVILEAMSLGKCVISSRVGGIPEVIDSGENGLLHLPGDIPALVAMLARAVDPDLRETLGRGGRARYLEQFTPDVIVPRIRQVYSELA